MSGSKPFLTDMEISFMLLLAVTLSCPVQTSVKTCRPNQFSCGDTKCVPMIWRCDGDSDCLNGADEEGCDKICRSKEFSCGDKHKTCVPMIWRCDGESDCLNGADEEGCVTQGEAAAITSQNQTAQSEDLTAHESKKSSGSNGGRSHGGGRADNSMGLTDGDGAGGGGVRGGDREPMRRGNREDPEGQGRADGSGDRDIGADLEGRSGAGATEDQAVKTCRPNQFSCGDTKCVPMAWKCDGDSDCLNGADEEGCDKICRSKEFNCGDKHKTCVPMIWRCDGESDCLNGADEEGCVTQGEAAAITSQNQTAQSEDE